MGHTSKFFVFEFSYKLFFSSTISNVNLHTFLKNGSVCRYIFSTEGHLLPMTPGISLVREHCSYFGAYCKNSHIGQDPTSSSYISKDAHQSNNSTRFQRGLGSTSYVTKYAFHKSTSISGIIKVSC